MIVVPGRFIFLMNPHTGSRSMVAGFVRGGLDVPEVRTHHVKPEDIPDLGLPRYAILRDTVDWAYAFYWHSWPKPLEQFLEEFNGRLNIYDGYVDKYFRFEDGLEVVLAELGFPQSRPLPTIGNNQGKKNRYFTQLDAWELLEREQMLVTKFNEDYRQYWREFGNAMPSFDD